MPLLLWGLGSLAPKSDGCISGEAGREGIGNSAWGSCECRLPMANAWKLGLPRGIACCMGNALSGICTWRCLRAMRPCMCDKEGMSDGMDWDLTMSLVFIGPLRPLLDMGIGMDCLGSMLPGPMEWFMFKPAT